ncbi:ran GTPase-activating protein 1b isoform X2 [Pseudochaenichthys georgianus]|uniref:ran GTPase-activating protein 1b isoform X2 n=1 Tax=Pseudochaenichthys georgianus TaxID=52239 RepID=UPI00146F2072|nr:ran GTPase-activating protein 1b isoform X2 [Pseudochaenichthys georgianus]
MASDDIALLADALSKTHVGDGELSFKGLGLKLDDAQSVEELVRDIEQFRGLRALRLEGNTVGVEAARAIAKALEDKDQLQRCYWSDMFTGRLRSEIPTALRSLGSALMTAGARLTELDLSDNAFGPDGVKGVEQLLKSPSCHSLKELRLNNCGVGIGGGKLMGSLEEVHMPQNGINHAGVMALASAMRHNPDLRVLNLNDNTFTKRGTIAMAQALRHLRNVQVINFGDCLVRSEGAIALAAVLREGLPVLKEINLSFGEITEAAALVVAQAVRDKPDMEKVDLNGNCLGEEGCDALREAMEKGDMLGSLSDDEGEPEEDEDDDQDDHEEEEEEEDDDDASDECNEDGEILKENGTTKKDDSPEKPQSSAEIMSFLSCPSAEKLLQLGETRTNVQQQVHASDPHTAAEILLKISSLYSEQPETKTAVLETIDAVLKKLLSGSDLSSYCFLSTLLVMMGLLKGEGKVKKVPLVPGQLLCLEHAVQQEYFPQHVALLLHTFTSRNSEALESCSSARERLSSTLEKKCH